VIHIEDLKAWLIAQGITTSISLGPTNQPTAEPHNCYTIWETGRIGLTTEDVFDLPTFQCLTRGANGLVARDLAEAFDNKMLGAQNITLGGKYALEIRNISGPSNLGTDNYGTQPRTEFTANYRILIAR